jgi:hypothetical protein
VDEEPDDEVLDDVLDGDDVPELELLEPELLEPESDEVVLAPEVDPLDALEPDPPASDLPLLA